jgi:MYXO-CTERM domain-containing protein
MILRVLWPVISVWLASPPIPATTGGITGPRDPQPIFGGDPVEPGEWPTVVGVTTTKRCTGTLVAPDLVLTAAHCFEPEPSGQVSISFGNDFDAPDTVIVSEDWGRHPDFCLPADCGEDLSDFAWIRLPNPVDGVEPIPPLQDQAEFDEVMRVGQPLHVIGFGQDEFGVIGIKRDAEVELTKFNESGREFEAGGDGNDTCSGDSGGPAFAQLSTGEWRLAGVTSRGGACGEGGIYGVPNPELCWVRDSSGVDLLGAGCEACDCVSLHGQAVDEGCGCGLEQPDGRLGLLALVGLFAVTRRRRSPS